MASHKLHILLRGTEESWNSFSRRTRETEGEAIIVLSSADNKFLLQEAERRIFLSDVAKIRYRVRLATKEPAVIASARKQGIRVYERTRQLRTALSGHPKSTEALRIFSPSLWRQQWRSRLQSMGLLSLPKLRIWSLIVLSAALFLFVILRLLPSAEVKIRPRVDLVNQTMNITLVHSGVTLTQSHVRTLPLLPLTVKIHKSITFDQISPEFIGSNSEVTMTITNKKSEAMSLRQGSRLMNQAGMIFRIQKGVQIAPNSKTTVKAKADDLDLYGKVIGDRGNVPAGLTWEFPALPEADRKLLTAQNLSAATGGRTAYRTVLQQKDLEIGKKRLEQELLATARQLIEEERETRSADNPGASIQLLFKDDLIKQTFTGFVLPTQFLGQAVTSVPIEGSLVYTVPAYDASLILNTYSRDLQTHIGEGKQLVPGSITLDPDSVVVIEYADDLVWIKVTVDIVGAEQFQLDPFTPAGAKFGKKLREGIAGISRADALRIIKNFPEVEKVSIAIWPPWSDQIPSIPSNISIEQQ